MAARITMTINVPMAVLITPPTPPVRGVPPTSTATIASRRKPFARFASPPESLTENTRPAIPAKAPEIAKARIFTRSTFRPEATAASSPEPTAFSARPKLVRVWRNHATASSTIAMANWCGTPAVLSNIQPKLVFLSVTSMESARCPDRYLAADSATKPIASVETNDGT